jgi:exodeoxyribonuclease VII small subunit
MAVKPRGSDANGDSYEAHLEALDRVIADLEGDALSLEATIDRYKEGVSHLGSCRKILDAAEKRLAELVASGDAVEERPLEVGPDGLVDVGRASGSSGARAATPSPSGSRVARITPETRLSPENGDAVRAKPAAGAATPSRGAPSPQEVGDDLPF